MTTPKTSWNASPPLRLELGASRLLAMTLVVLGVVAAGGLLLTDLPIVVAAPAGVAVVAWSMHLARRERLRGRTAIVLRADGRVEIGGMPVDRFRLDWQGIFAVLEWQAGSRRHRRVGWPDVLDAAARRELRLWALGRGVRASTAAVAP